MADVRTRFDDRRAAAPTVRTSHDRFPVARRGTADPLFSEKSIRRTARTLGPRGSILAVCFKARWHEWALKHKRRVDFRSRENAAACAAYDRMSVADFAIINSAQTWANWRTIPRNLRGRLPSRPLAVIDLCCGTGDSTAVLAYYCPPGSRILGLEWSGTFVDAARRRSFIDATGNHAAVMFRRQDVLDPFADVEGRHIADRSVDLINAQGAVGSHFDRGAIQCLAAQCRRVIRDGGLAMVDAGRRSRNFRDVVTVWTDCGFELVHRAESCPWDKFVQLCFRKRPE